MKGSRPGIIHLAYSPTICNTTHHLLMQHQSCRLGPQASRLLCTNQCYIGKLTVAIWSGCRNRCTATASANHSALLITTDRSVMTTVAEADHVSTPARSPEPNACSIGRSDQAQAAGS